MLNVILYTNHHHYCKPTSTNHHPKSTNHRNHNLTTIDSHKHNHCNLSKSSHKNNPKKHHHNQRERERERERDLYGVPAWWKAAWWDHRLASQERSLGDISNGPKEEAWRDRQLARGSFGRLGAIILAQYCSSFAKWSCCRWSFLFFCLLQFSAIAQTKYVYLFLFLFGCLLVFFFFF